MCWLQGGPELAEAGLKANLSWHKAAVQKFLEHRTDGKPGLGSHLRGLALEERQLTRGGAANFSERLRRGKSRCGVYVRSIQCWALIRGTIYGLLCKNIEQW